MFLRLPTQRHQVSVSTKLETSLLSHSWTPLILHASRLYASTRSVRTESVRRTRTTQATCRRKRRAKLPTQAMCADSHNLRFTMPAHVSTVHMSTPQAACHAVVGATTTSGAQPQTLILMRCAICWRAPGREHTAVWSARSVSLIEAGARGM